MDRGTAVCNELKRAGVQYMLWLPDSETHFMQEPIQRDPAFHLMQVCREGEALGICAGLHLGGSKGALLIENAGLFDAGNILKWIIGAKIPLIMLVGYLFYAYMERTPVGLMGRHGKDYTEPFLKAFDIPYYLVDSDADVPKVGLACQEAWRLRKPVAVLLTAADKWTQPT